MFVHSTLTNSRLPSFDMVNRPYSSKNGRICKKFRDISDELWIRSQLTYLFNSSDSTGLAHMMYWCIVPHRLYYDSAIKAERIDCYIMMLFKAVQGERNAKTSTVIKWANCQSRQLNSSGLEPLVAPIEEDIADKYNLTYIISERKHCVGM